MSELQDEVIVTLERRVEALETALRARRAFPRVSHGAVVLLALTGWTLTHSSVPLLGQQPAPAQEPAAIEKGRDGITRVRGPFQVVDEGGQVLLGVARGGDGSAAVSVGTHGGAGVVAVLDSGGAALASMARNDHGYGWFAAYDAKGTARATIHGGTGSFRTVNEAGKQVAMLTSVDGKGVVGVWGSAGSQRIIALSEGSGGGGELTVFDSAHRTVGTIKADAAGGALELFGASKGTPSVDLGLFKDGAGYAAVADPGGKRTALLTGADADGSGAVVIEKDGRAFASISMNKAGAGDLILANADGGFGV